MAKKHQIYKCDICGNTDGDTICKQFLKPGDDPAGVFKSAGTGVTAREYCNVRGLWKS